MNLIDIVKYVEKNKNSALFYTPKIYEDARSFFIEKLTTSVIIDDISEIDSKLQLIDTQIENGKTIIPLINYEFGYLLEERLQKHKNEKSVAEFYITDSKNVKELSTSELVHDGIKEIMHNNLVDNFKLDTSKEEYIKNVERIKDHIKVGNTYQVNYTIQSSFDLVGSISDLFFQLIFSQSAKYIALIHLDDRYILSSSPELFFEISNDKIVVKPMKGTIARGINIEEDENQKERLKASYKDQAENVMIVDLLRNDLGKICEYDSVKLKTKFDIEKYESIFQLTSTIEGKLKTKKLSEIIKNLFPSGSITGAPKLRTMEIITELEDTPRGIYTGLIGILRKDFSVTNVAIRTISISKNKNAKLGIGSGIVWDSDPESEYDEVLLKSNFLTKPSEYFEIFESMLVENGEVFLFELHLTRLQKAAEYFLFKFDRNAIVEFVNQKILQLDETKKYKLRLSLTKWGKFTCAIEELNNINKPMKLIISNDKVNSKNRFQYFKTTKRELYDTKLNSAKAQGFDEVIFFNEKDDLAEGSFTNILISLNGELLTPSISSGILNGCFREYLIRNEKKIREKEISREAFLSAEKIILINSVRKEMQIDQLFDENGKLIKQFN